MGLPWHDYTEQADVLAGPRRCDQVVGLESARTTETVRLTMRDEVLRILVDSPVFDVGNLDVGDGPFPFEVAAGASMARFECEVTVLN